MNTTQIIQKLADSKETKKMLDTLDERQSIINQGEVHIERKIIKEALRIAQQDKYSLPS